MYTDNLFNVVTIKPLTQACQNCIKLINVSIDIILNDMVISFFFFFLHLGLAK